MSKSRIKVKHRTTNAYESLRWKGKGIWIIPVRNSVQHTSLPNPKLLYLVRNFSEQRCCCIHPREKVLQRACKSVFWWVSIFTICHQNRLLCYWPCIVFLTTDQRMIITYLNTSYNGVLLFHIQNVLTLMFVCFFSMHYKFSIWSAYTLNWAKNLKHLWHKVPCSLWPPSRLTPSKEVGTDFRTD